MKANINDVNLMLSNKAEDEGQGQGQGPGQGQDGHLHGVEMHLEDRQEIGGGDMKNIIAARSTGEVDIED
eukprot:COSAG04_NODE_18354_length_444_cov_1.223188_1_plen_69_part_10